MLGGDLPRALRRQLAAEAADVEVLEEALLPLRASAGAYSKPALTISSSFGGTASRTIASWLRCCWSPITRSAKARDGSDATASSGSASTPHRKARSTPCQFLSRANASIGTAHPAPSALSFPWRRHGSASTASPSASQRLRRRPRQDLLAERVVRRERGVEVGGHRRLRAERHLRQLPPRRAPPTDSVGVAARISTSFCRTSLAASRSSVARRSSMCRSFHGCAPDDATQPHVTPRSRCTAWSSRMRVLAAAGAGTVVGEFFLDAEAVVGLYVAHVVR